MRLVAKFALGAFVCFAPSGSVAAIAEGCSHEGESDAKLLNGVAPIQICAAVGSKTLRSIESGKTRVVLVLSEYKPPKSGKQSLSVTTLGGHEQVLGIYPGQAFDCESIDSHHRFLLVSPPNTAGLDTSTSICVSVKFTSSDGSGSAKLQLDMWTPEK